MGLCVSSWMGGLGGNLISGVFKAVLECAESFLCLFWLEDHTKSGAPRKPMRPVEKDEEC